MASLHDISMKPMELQVHNEAGLDDEGSDRSPISKQKRQAVTSRKTSIYADFNTEKLAEIKNIELDGPSFTTKVDTLVQHLLWLRETDPGAKSIIFSQ
jgi:E3 ubiquitin-protein ligase SHPRH